ncbi:MAG: hypothetical protein EBS90_08495 [Betaproteobacteria bacterium]|nr:hypothetical protein [Betaproteobacteria bacterium]
MTAFSGMTLEQLEQEHQCCNGDEAVLAGLHRELVDRKRRREAGGKTEKPRAAHLRQVISQELGGHDKPTTNSSFRQQAGPSELSVPAARAAAARPHRNGSSVLPKFSPTDEQMAAVSAFQTGEDVKINAFAGSGKTSTLTLLAEAVAGSGLYVAFNRACVKDAAGRFGNNVQCRTVHGVAYRALQGHFRRDKMAGKLNPNIVLSHVPVEPFSSGGMKLTDSQMASVALATLRRFAQSRHSDVRDIRVPRYGLLSSMPAHLEKEITAAVHRVVEEMWQKMCDRTSSMPLGHDGYLKYWAMQRPTLGFDYILLDEAQDTNDVVLGGGAINALDKVRTSKECALTQSFRFGPQIAELANVVLRRLGERKEIRGNRSVSSDVGTATWPDAIIARSNGAVLQAVMACLDGGRTPYVEGGTQELKHGLHDFSELNRCKFAEIDGQDCSQGDGDEKGNPGRHQGSRQQGTDSILGIGKKRGPHLVGNQSGERHLGKEGFRFRHQGDDDSKRDQNRNPTPKTQNPHHNPLHRLI